MTILITGAAGFVGYHLAKSYLDDGVEVVGVDNLNDYYDVALKRARLEQLGGFPNFRFHELDLADRAAVAGLFRDGGYSRVVHLAAQAGVRYSIDHPEAYVDSNLVAFGNVLEGCRHSSIPHLVYASSSSVYGNSQRVPFRESDPVDHPVSLYAATKKANELMAHTYAHLYGIPVTGLRFFTVYGPWGRPDMAYYKFALKMLAGETVDVFNHGDLQRDFTYIDDVVEGVVRVTGHVPPPGCCEQSGAPYQVFNIGNHQPVGLLTFIELLEQALGVRANKRLLPMQAGDVYTTYADTQRLRDAVGFAPGTPLEQGLGRFAEWFRHYHRA